MDFFFFFLVDASSKRCKTLFITVILTMTTAMTKNVPQKFVQLINLFVSSSSCSLNECYFAGKGTALMLGSNERLQRGDGRRFSQISCELSASQTSIGSSGSDIQQHLQSMFYLLRPEETLKMVRFMISEQHGEMPLNIHQ